MNRDEATLRYLDVQRLLKICKETFNWTSFSNDVVMDVCCGEHCNACRAVIQEYPDVKRLIAIDTDPSVVQRILERKPKFECHLGDIEDRESLRSFEGKITKLFSFLTFHRLQDKMVGFRNVYHLLKPGGEATIQYHLNSGLYIWLKEMSAHPEWHAMYQPLHLEDMYIDTKICRHADMIERIGLTVLQFAEDHRSVAYASDHACKESLYTIAKQTFRVPDPLVEKFKEECFRVFVKHSGRDTEGKARYFDRKIYFLLEKPLEEEHHTGFAHFNP